MRLLQRWRRRRPGVYAWRTDRHTDPTAREWGYVGESVNIALRDRCHLGTCRHVTCLAKSWTDLRPRRYTVIALPWWLGWKWVLRPLETLVILALAPRYNVAKNCWNPRRISPNQAIAQRHDRDTWPTTYRARVAAARLGRRALQLAGALCIGAGIAGALITR